MSNDACWCSDSSGVLWVCRGGGGASMVVRQVSVEDCSLCSFIGSFQRSIMALAILALPLSILTQMSASGSSKLSCLF